MPLTGVHAFCLQVGDELLPVPKELEHASKQIKAAHAAVKAVDKKLAEGLDAALSGAHKSKDGGGHGHHHGGAPSTTDDMNHDHNVAPWRTLNRSRHVREVRLGHLSHAVADLRQRAGVAAKRLYGTGEEDESNAAPTEARGMIDSVYLYCDMAEQAAGVDADVVAERRIKEAYLALEGAEKMMVIPPAPAPPPTTAATEPAPAPKSKKKPQYRKGSVLGNIDLDESLPLGPQLQAALSKNAVRVMDLFKEWDKNNE